MKRKSYTLKFNSNSQLEIKVPSYYNENEIGDIINKHQNWINKQIASYNPEKVQLIEDLNNFNKIMLLGKTYNLIFDSSIDFKGRTFFIDAKDNLILRNRGTGLKSIEYSYRNNFVEILKNLYSFNELFQEFKINEIKASNASGRWGSCSANGNINMSWRLMMAPLEVITSVFAHELTHTVVFNHSDKFYKILDKVDRNRKESDIWLKENGFILKLYK